MALNHRDRQGNLFRCDIDIAWPCRGEGLGNKNLTYVGEFLAEDGLFGPEPIVFGS